MAGVPNDVDLKQTSHFLFEIGSIMSLTFIALLVIATLPTAAVAYFTGSIPLFGGIAIVPFSILAFLGIGILYWSSKISEF